MIQNMTSPHVALSHQPMTCWSDRVEDHVGGKSGDTLFPVFLQFYKGLPTQVMHKVLAQVGRRSCWIVQLAPCALDFESESKL